MYIVSEQDEVLAKQGLFTHKGIEEAYQAKSPRLAELICKLLILDPAPRKMFIEAGRGVPTFKTIAAQIQKAVDEQQIILHNLPSDNIARQTPTNRISPIYSVQYIWQGHQNVWKHLTSERMKDLLPERVRLYEIILSLWNDNSSYAREQLISILKFARLKYGAWKAFKQIFKEAELRFDWEVYGILNDRCSHRSWSWGDRGLQYIWITPEDQEQKKVELSSENEDDDHYHYEPDLVNWSNIKNRRDSEGDYQFDNYTKDPSTKTFEYLNRRARRTFRKLASDFPEVFPAAAAEMLLSSESNSLVARYVMNQRELWLSQQAPLMKIVEQSRNTNHVNWAYELLKKEFRLEMKQVSADWLYRISQSPIKETRSIALDYLENVTGVGEGAFHEKGYHKTIIGFLGLDFISNHSAKAVDFAVSYLQSVMANENSSWLVQAFPLQKVASLLRMGTKQQKIGMHLLQGNEKESPYEKEFSLEFFTVLLHDQNTFDFASSEIRKRYTGLKPDWFRDVLLSKFYRAYNFAINLLKDSTMVAQNVDWSDFSMNLLSSMKASSSVYEAAWLRLISTSMSGEKLIEDRNKISIEFIRFMFLHSNTQVQGYALECVENGYCSIQELGVDFLKTICTKREYEQTLEAQHAWTAFVGVLMNTAVLDYLKQLRVNKKSPYSHRNGEKIRKWLSVKDNFSLNDIGLEWAFERLQNWNAHYNFVRDVFVRDVSLDQLSTVLPPLSKSRFESDNKTINGARQAAWYIYHRCQDANSKKANFYKKLLKERNPRYRMAKGLPPLEQNMVWPSETFDFTWFSRWATSKREPIRQYAIEISRYEMNNWIQAGKIGFPALRPLVSRFFDVQKAIVQAIHKPVAPVMQSRIDVALPSFTAKDLYLYCFGANELEVDFALTLIKKKRDLFGQPNDLLALSDAKSPKARQVVINVLWELYKNPDVSYDWKPFPYSVVPYSMSAAIDPVREASVDPNTLSGDNAKFGKNKHFIGLGTASEPLRKELTDDNRFDLEEFLRRILYTLPKNPVVLKAEEAARKAKNKSQAELVVKSSWRNKRTLVSAVRDLALQDKEFAIFVQPILKEFGAVRGKMLKNACLTALTQIRIQHQLQSH